MLHPKGKIPKRPKRFGYTLSYMTGHVLGFRSGTPMRWSWLLFAWLITLSRIPIIFYYQQECNTLLLPHLDFSFHSLMERITADILDPWENRQILDIAYRFGSLYRVHSRFKHAEVLLYLTWMQRQQALDYVKHAAAIKRINSI